MFKAEPFFETFEISTDINLLLFYLLLISIQFIIESKKIILFFPYVY